MVDIQFWFKILAIVIMLLVAFIIERKIKTYQKPEFNEFVSLRPWYSGLIPLISPKVCYKEDKVTKGFLGDLSIVILVITALFIFWYLL